MPCSAGSALCLTSSSPATCPTNTGISKGREWSPSSPGLKWGALSQQLISTCLFQALWPDLASIFVPQPLGRGGYNRDQWAEQTLPTKAWKDSMSSEYGDTRFTTSLLLSRKKQDVLWGQPELPKELRENRFLKDMSHRVLTPAPSISTCAIQHVPQRARYHIRRAMRVPRSV